MKLKELLEKRAAEIKEKINASQSVEEVRELGETLRAITEELRSLEEAMLEDPNVVPANAVLRNSAVINANGQSDDDDLEYRNAFMNFVLRNEPIPTELRQDANTLTTDVASAIPTVLVNRIVEKIESVGMVLAQVTKTTFAAGVSIPTSSVKPVASWVSEGASSDRQKKTTGVISFSYHKLRCEVSMSMEVGSMALSSFEAKFVENVAEAMVKALEEAIINGDGSGKPKGILAETPVTGQSLTDTTYNFAKLVACEGVLPEAYETTAKWCMSKKTFSKVLGMVDSNGQPIARVNFGIGGQLERTINGREVVIAPYVAENTLFMFDFRDYVLNTVYDMGISKKQDWDTEDLLTKAVMSVDGKVVSKDSLVKLVVTPAA